MALTTQPQNRARVDAADLRLSPPSGLPRRLVIAGLFLALAGCSSLLAAVVSGVLVGFDDPSTTGDLAPPLPLGVLLTLLGGFVAQAGWVFARADGRRP